MVGLLQIKNYLPIHYLICSSQLLCAVSTAISILNEEASSEGMNNYLTVTQMMNESVSSNLSSKFLSFSAHQVS